MFVGHGLVAFALVATVASRLGVDSERAIRVGVVAALFATLPDVDVIYGFAGVLASMPAGIDPVTGFWTAGNLVHRGPTHSLVVGVVTALGFAAFSVWRSQPDRLRSLTGLAVAIAASTLVVWIATTFSGVLAGLFTVLFVGGGLAIVLLADRLGLSSSVVLGASLAGLLTHPFGDLLTGTPPALLYPFESVVIAERVALSPDPTIQLLTAFAVELSTVWVALSVYYSLSGRLLRRHVSRRATAGLAYGAVAVVVPSPTLDVSYPFVYSVLSVGVVGVIDRQFPSVRLERAVPTAVAAVTLGAVAYTVVYLLAL